MRSFAILLSLLLIISGESYAVTLSADSSYIYEKTLDDVIVIQQKKEQLIKDSANQIVVNLHSLDVMPKFLGTTDPIRYLQTIAGVQTNGEGFSGIYVQGCDDHHTMTSINGAPVYYPNHLLGLFSTFIPSHFENMVIEKSIHDASFSNRLAANVALEPYTSYDKKIGVEGNVGLIESDLTMPIKFNDKNTLYLSARSSYIGMLYGSMLQFEGMKLNYDFQDFNLTYCYEPSQRDKLIVSAYYGMDNASLLDKQSVVDVGIRWSNLATSLSYKHIFDNCVWHTDAHFSGFQNRVDVSESVINVDASSKLASTGIKSFVNISLGDKILLKSGAEWLLYFNEELSFESEGIGLESQHDAILNTMHEVSVFADLKHNVASWFNYSVGLRPTLWKSDKIFYGISPRITFNFPINNEHLIKAHYGIYGQALHKAGLTDGGLPTDYFFLATKQNKPTFSHSATIGYEGSVLKKAYSFSLDFYFKQLYNTIESTSNIMELIYTGFNYEDGLTYGKGRNYGMNLMFNKNKGYVKGYISYTLGWAMRNFPDLAEGYVVRARHDRRHNLIVMLNSEITKHWSLGAMFVLASGAPYTPFKSSYILNGQIMYEFGTHNSASMPLYHRLDLSVNYYIIRKLNQELGINLSLYNVYCHKNAQFMITSGYFQQKKMTLLPFVIPSLSVFFRF